MIDLTSFGFTPTESQAYTALLSLGPSSGYAVARSLAIARANGYQALDGLVTKGAAIRLGAETPRRYRAVQPRSLFAALLDAESRKVDELERQLTAQPAEGASPLVRLEGDRALKDVAERAIVRSDEPVRLASRAGVMGALAPALRARAGAGKEMWVSVAGALDFEPPFPVQFIAPDMFDELFPTVALLLVADGVLVTQTGDGAEGFWSESPLMREVVGAALGRLG
jgi:sugar-specific transcriptional regulator TrmB